MKTTNLIIIILLTSYFLGTITLRAENSKTDDKEIEWIKVCQKPVKTPGPGDTLSTVAKLKTIIIWSEKVKNKYGEDYAQWHKANGKKVKCNKKSGSNYYYCELRAIPCTYKEKDNEEEPKNEDSAKDTETKS